MKMEEITYEIRDVVMGKIVCTTKKGAYVQIDDSLQTTGFFFGGGRVGDTVLCSVRSLKNPWSILLSLDSVLYSGKPSA